MEEFFEFVWAIIIIVASVSISAAKKKKKERQRHFTPVTVSASPQPAAPKAAPAAPVHMIPPLPKASQPVRTPMQPTIHPHVEPDCDTHDIPGSLGVTSMEGRDPCHEEQMDDLSRTAFAPVREEAGISLDWSGQNMVKAFVMQEVLTRPCDRRRAR